MFIQCDHKLVQSQRVYKYLYTRIFNVKWKKESCIIVCFVSGVIGFFTCDGTTENDNERKQQVS